MSTTLSVQLLNRELTLPDLTIGQAIDIAQIPQEYNEKRLSALIGHMSGDPLLAATLTVQERYYLLLSYQAVSSHSYSDESSIEDYSIETLQSEIPDAHQIGDIHVQHLRGAHVCVLEGLCENVFDWLCGQIACQLYGDLTSVLGDVADSLTWDQALSTLTDNELSSMVKERYEFIKGLSANTAFNDLVETYHKAVFHLEHFVELGCDNQGLTLIKQGGAGTVEPARFLTLDHLQGAAARIAKCVNERRYDHDGTRQNELV